jgi:hypothetical protein
MGSSQRLRSDKTPAFSSGVGFSSIGLVAVCHAGPLYDRAVYRPERRICKTSWWPTTHSPSAQRICNDSDAGAPAAS